MSGTYSVLAENCMSDSACKDDHSSLSVTLTQELQPKASSPTQGVSTHSCGRSTLTDLAAIQPWRCCLVISLEVLSGKGNCPQAYLG